jgi:U6 snRNA-associated Sm-like protein LSm8
VIEKCKERVYTMEGVTENELGLYIIRGELIAVIGELDPSMEKELELEAIYANPIPPISN